MRAALLGGRRTCCCHLLPGEIGSRTSPRTPSGTSANACTLTRKYKYIQHARTLSLMAGCIREKERHRPTNSEPTNSFLSVSVLCAHSLRALAPFKRASNARINWYIMDGCIRSIWWPVARARRLRHQLRSQHVWQGIMHSCCTPERLSSRAELILWLSRRHFSVSFISNHLLLMIKNLVLGLL